MTGPDVLIGGRYRLVNRLGAGGMSTVWQAWDERLRRPVAVKLLHHRPGLSHAEIELAVERATREARITAKLHHPNAVQVFDIVDHEAQPCLIMQYVPSISLSELVRDKGPLSVVDVARIGIQLAGALAAAHRGGIVHRDVKPGNVLIAEDGSAKITDFGISHTLGDVSLTSTGMLTGTPAYLAPEVARGRSSTFAADVFSLGSTLYFAATGSAPFGNDANPMAVLHRVASGEPPEPVRNPALRPVLEAMMVTDPGLRPDMVEVAHALTRVAATDTAADAPTALLERPGEGATRALPLGAAGAGAGAAGAGAAGAGASEARAAGGGAAGGGAAGGGAAGGRAPVGRAYGPPAGPPPPSAAGPGGPGEPPRRRRARWPIVLGVVLLAALVGVLVALAVVNGGGSPGSGTSSPASTGASSSPGRGGNGSSARSSAQHSTSTHHSSAATTSSSATPSSSPPTSPSTSASSSAPSSSSATTSSTAPTSSAASGTATSSAAALAAAISSYYAVVPDDTDAGWQRLTPHYRANTAHDRSEYDSFWSRIARVDVGAETPHPPDTVVATLVYHFTTGRVVTERTRFGLVRSDGQLKINSSAVLSSS